MTLRMLFRCLAWLLLAAIAYSTLSPIELRPVTGFSADLERFVAFAAVGAAFCLGYPKRRFAIVLMVVGTVGLLELAQHLVPGRHGHFHDVLVKASGAVLGAFTTLLAANEKPAIG
jgi:VanZ family protein